MEKVVMGIIEIRQRVLGIYGTESNGVDREDMSREYYDRWKE